MDFVIRQLFVSFFLILLVSCGGGDGLEEGSSEELPATYVLSLQLLDLSGQPTEQFFSDEAVRLSARLQSSSGDVASRRLGLAISGSRMAQPLSYAMTTNQAGVATLEIPPGRLKGRGEILASYGSLAQASLPFDAQTLKLVLSLTDRKGEPLHTLTPTQPGQLTAYLSDDGSPVPYALVRFSLGEVGALTPSTGSALTDADGVASVTLLAGQDAGAGLVQGMVSLDGVELSRSLAFASTGEASSGEPVGGEQLLIALLSSASGASTSEISADDPGLVQVQLLDSAQRPVAGRVVSFTTTLGQFLPASATALTDSSGRASILLKAGSIQGAGEVEASFDGVVTRLGFVTLGDEIDPDSVVPQIGLALYDCNEAAGWDRAVRNFEACQPTSNITNASPGVVAITLTQSGSNQPLPQRLVSASTTLGAISPAAGTAMTDEQGRALLDLYANGDLGAGELTVEIANQSRLLAFEVGRVSVRLAVSNSLGEQTLPAGGSAIVRVETLNPDGTLAVDQPLVLELSSQCAAAGLAQIDSPVTTVAGVGLATYLAQGCQGQDRIGVSAQTGGSTVVGETQLMVAESAIGSLQFVSAEPGQLALKGSGGIDGAGQRSETALVTFRLLDQSGAAASQEKVCFELSTGAGGLKLSPEPQPQDLVACPNVDQDATDLSRYAVGYSNSQGRVSVTVGAGDVPTQVKVFAVWAGSDGGGHPSVVSNLSDALVVTTGLADDDSLSLSASLLNPEAWEFDGEEVVLTMMAADHFNNPVPDGTLVTFTAEGGAIDARCATKSSDDGSGPEGACQVTWRSQSPRPFYIPSAVTCPSGDPPPCLGDTLEAHFNGLGSVIAEPRPGRATVMLRLIGEESFVDLNGNGVFDGAPESYVDRTEAFRDDNEDGLYRNYSVDGLSQDGAVSAGAVAEEFFDYDADGQFDGVDGLYTGLLCHGEAAAQCVDSGLDPGRAQLMLWRNLTLVMSGSVPFGKLRQLGSGGALQSVVQLDLVSNDSQSVLLFLSDQNNNPLPYGTRVTASTSNGQLVGVTDYTLGSTNAMIPGYFSFTVEQETSPNDRTQGTLTITVATPKGTPAAFSVSVLDGG
ncbi:invasin [Ferrimonas sediminicola]|uniref:Invasin n=1 Tax=Ferrimonas sediminicola TaxID=2569538 RepID=A0A4U1BDA4_9GAMM|nr:invasin [Ferrimonas sediminicola]TKB49069.1 invasin [Ferrimonas sediminicola]